MACYESTYFSTRQEIQTNTPLTDFYNLTTPKIWNRKQNLVSLHCD